MDISLPSEYAPWEEEEESIEPSPMKFGVLGYTIFTVSSTFLIVALILVFRHRKDDQFQYRSPWLVMFSFLSALIANLV